MTKADRRGKESAEREGENEKRGKERIQKKRATNKIKRDKIGNAKTWSVSGHKGRVI